MTTPTLPLPPLEVVGLLNEWEGGYSQIAFVDMREKRWLDKSLGAPDFVEPLVRLSDAQASIEEERAGRAIERELAEARANDAADLAVKLSDAQASLEALRAEMGELRKDAERYRWLRCGDNDEAVMRTYDDKTRKARPFDARYDDSWLLRNEELDAAIDSAIDQAASAGKESEG